ncbi:MAG: hypothetical protein LBN12_04720, partial [Clostridiales Family XIII bacterium]|nr:hypothetical protein [Clostridiales Family XIII bacterium]
MFTKFRVGVLLVAMLLTSLVTGPLGGTGGSPFGLVAYAADEGVSAFDVKSKTVSGEQVYWLTNVDVATPSATYESVIFTYSRELSIHYAGLPAGWEITVNEGLASVGGFNSATLTTGTTGTEAELEAFLGDKTKIWFTAAGNYSAANIEIIIQAFVEQMAKFIDAEGQEHYYRFVRTDGATGNGVPFKTWMQAYNLAYDAIMPGTSEHGYLATITSIEEQLFVYNSIAKLPGWLGGTRMRYTDAWMNSTDNSVVTDKAAYSNNWVGANGETHISETNANYTYAVGTATQWYWAAGPEATSSGGLPLVFYNGYTIAQSSNSDKTIAGVFNFFTNVYTRNRYPEHAAIITPSGSEPNNAGNIECVLQFAQANRGSWNDLTLDYVGGAVSNNGYYVEWTPSASTVIGGIKKDSSDITAPNLVSGGGDYVFEAQDAGYNAAALANQFVVKNNGTANTGALTWSFTGDTAAFDVSVNDFAGDATALNAGVSGGFIIAPKPGITAPDTYRALVEIYETSDPDNAISFYVSFTLKDYAVTASSNAGTVTLSPSQTRFVKDATVAYSVTPTDTAHYYFDNWTQTGGAMLSGTTTIAGGTFAMPTNDVTLTANFAPRPTVVSVSPNGTGRARSGDLVITFSEAMNTGAGTRMVALSPNTGVSLSAGVWSNGGRTFTVPYSGLAWNTTYTVSVTDFKNTSQRGDLINSTSLTFQTRAQTEETIHYEYYLPSAVTPVVTLSEDKTISAGTFAYDLLQIPKYAVASATITNGSLTNQPLPTTSGSGAWLDTGSLQIKAINPAQGETTLKIQLASTLTDVTVKAVNDNAGGATLQTVTAPNVTIGSTFTFPAPVIDGYQLATGQSLTAALPGDGKASLTNNEITIHYIPLPAGNTVFHYEIPASWVGSFDLTAFKANPGTYTYDGLKARLISQYTATGNLGAAVTQETINGFTYSSSDPVSPKITATAADNIYFFYTPNFIDVTVNTYVGPSGTTQIPGTSPVVKPYQEGDYVTIDAPVIANYTVNAPASQGISVSSGAHADFYYTKNSEIAVSVLYEDGSSNSLGAVNSVTGYAGSKFKAAPPTFGGYTFAQAYTHDGTNWVTAASPVEITVDSNPAKNQIRFVYTDARQTVTVQTKRGAGGTVTAATYKVESGQSIEIPVPYLPGWSLAKYKIGAAGEVTSDVSSVNTGAVNGPLTVLFTYQTVSD